MQAHLKFFFFVVGGGALGGLAGGSAQAQTSASFSDQTIQRETYTNEELAIQGMNSQEIQLYRDRLKGIEGQWWGHVTPIEFLMYSAKSDDERKKYARRYIETSFPKSMAERRAIAAMDEAAKEFSKESIDFATNVLETQEEDVKPIVFIDANCQECAQKLLTFIHHQKGISDIYVTNANPEDPKDIKLINWARRLKLPPSKITLNHDAGIYQKKYKRVLKGIHIMEEGV